jgi:hypothetical protein
VVVIQLVDANQTPVAGVRAEVRFEVADPAISNGGGLAWKAPGAWERGDAQRDASGDPDSAAEALPLVSAVGFSALAGGVISSLKSR